MNNDPMMQYTASLYLQKLATGRNPLDGESLPEENDWVFDPDLQRSLQYAADALQHLCMESTRQTPRSAREPFRISPDQRKAIFISTKPVGVSVVANRVNKVLEPNVTSVAGGHMTAWMQNCGLLKTETTDGETMKVPTKEGEELGITIHDFKTRDGRDYRKCLYNSNAQTFLVDNLENIAEYTAQARAARLKQKRSGPKSSGSA
ncbi:MAG: hypothetical protein IIZ60_00295 [Clostridia bacterium]|jgi:hypothetical protein|nr:hypothetical protein [Clostridia bacterium]